MASSSLPTEARSLSSSHHDLWHMSWGETEAIAAVRAEMMYQHPQRGAGGKGQVQPQARPQATTTTTPLQVGAPGFQPCGFVMATIPGTQCQFPTVLFMVQPEQHPANVLHTESKQSGNSQTKAQAGSHARRSTHHPSADDCFSKRTDGIGLVVAKTNGDKRPCPQVLTRESFEGDLPSIGSEGHFDGSCKRCAFFPKGRCNNGKDCAHCHFTHEARTRLRKKTNKAAYRQENALPEILPAGSSMIEDANCTEVLNDLTQLVTASSPGNVQEAPIPFKESHGEHQSVPNADSETSAAGMEVTMRFNNAIEEISEAYKSSMVELVAESKANETVDFRNDAADLSTAPSASALSEDALSDMSDLEVSSLTAGTSQLDEDEMSPSQHNPSASPSSWAAMQRRRKADHSTVVDIGRASRALLNKLTEQRFESLCSQILSLPLSTPEELAAVVAEIFHKATTQDGFRKLYTELCMRLDTHLTVQAGSIGGRAFRKALLNECQATFERNLMAPDATLFEDMDADECFELEMKLKTQRLGNMRFIGELLVRRLLAPKLLPPIVHELLNGDEAALEGLMALLHVVAPEFETKASLYQAILLDAFAVLHQKIADKAVCPRVCCQIDDLLDAKARGWAPRSTSR